MSVHIEAKQIKKEKISLPVGKSVGETEGIAVTVGGIVGALGSIRKLVSSWVLIVGRGS